METKLNLKQKTGCWLNARWITLVVILVVVPVVYYVSAQGGCISDSDCPDDCSVCDTTYYTGSCIPCSIMYCNNRNSGDACWHDKCADCACCIGGGCVGSNPSGVCCTQASDCTTTNPCENVTCTNNLCTYTQRPSGAQCSVGTKSGKCFYSSCCLDKDEDGYVDKNCAPAYVESDCNDDDPSVYPGAEEICDNKDTDCDWMTTDDQYCEDPSHWGTLGAPCTSHMCMPSTLSGTPGFDSATGCLHVPNNQFCSATGTDNVMCTMDICDPTSNDPSKDSLGCLHLANDSSCPPNICGWVDQFGNIVGGSTTPLPNPGSGAVPQNPSDWPAVLHAVCNPPTGCQWTVNDTCDSESCYNDLNPPVAYHGVCVFLNQPGGNPQCGSMQENCWSTQTCGAISNATFSGEVIIGRKCVMNSTTQRSQCSDDVAQTCDQCQKCSPKAGNPSLMECVNLCTPPSNVSWPGPCGDPNQWFRNYQPSCESNCPLSQGWNGVSHPSCDGECCCPTDNCNYWCTEGGFYYSGGWHHADFGECGFVQAGVLAGYCDMINGVPGIPIGSGFCPDSQCVGPEGGVTCCCYSNFGGDWHWGCTGTWCTILPGEGDNTCNPADPNACGSLSTLSTISSSSSSTTVSASTSVVSTSTSMVSTTTITPSTTTSLVTLSTTTTLSCSDQCANGGYSGGGCFGPISCQLNCFCSQCGDSGDVILGWGSSYGCEQYCCCDRPLTCNELCRNTGYTRGSCSYGCLGDIFPCGTLGRLLIGSGDQFACNSGGNCCCDMVTTTSSSSSSSMTSSTSTTSSTTTTLTCPPGYSCWAECVDDTNGDGWCFDRIADGACNYGGPDGVCCLSQEVPCPNCGNGMANAYEQCDPPALYCMPPFSCVNCHCVLTSSSTTTLTSSTSTSSSSTSSTSTSTTTIELCGGEYAPCGTKTDSQSCNSTYYSFHGEFYNCWWQPDFGYCTSGPLCKLMCSGGLGRCSDKTTRESCERTIEEDPHWVYPCVWSGPSAGCGVGLPLVECTGDCGSHLDFCYSKTTEESCTQTFQEYSNTHKLYQCFWNDDSSICLRYAECPRSGGVTTTITSKCCCIITSSTTTTLPPTGGSDIRGVPL